MEYAIVIGAILVLLVLSAFFSGSETSLTAASRSRMHNLEQQGEARAELVNRLLDRKERLIGSILLGNNLVNILASALATSLLIGLVGDAGVAYATIVMTLMVLIFDPQRRPGRARRRTPAARLRRGAEPGHARRAVDRARDS